MGALDLLGLRHDCSDGHRPPRALHGPYKNSILLFGNIRRCTLAKPSEWISGSTDQNNALKVRTDPRLLESSLGEPTRVPTRDATSTIRYFCCASAFLPAASFGAGSGSAAIALRSSMVRLALRSRTDNVTSGFVARSPARIQREDSIRFCPKRWAEPMVRTTVASVLA